MITLEQQIEDMFTRELDAHGRAFVHYEALRDVQVKPYVCDGLPVEMRFNPSRVHSVMAKVDKDTLAKRPCFLCPTGLEEKQLTTTVELVHTKPEGFVPEGEMVEEDITKRGRFVSQEEEEIRSKDAPSSNKAEYFIRVNPFPIFERHFTISYYQHVPQRIQPHFPHMLLLADALPHYTIFYNGPACGASAPDHMHFQAVPMGSLPVQRWVDAGHKLAETAFFSGARLLEFTDREACVQAFEALLQEYPIQACSSQSATHSFNQIEEEPRMNVVAWKIRDTYRVVAFFRRESRPACFFAEEASERILFSPGSVEMSGIGIVSDADSFQKTNATNFLSMIQEVSWAK